MPLYTSIYFIISYGTSSAQCYNPRASGPPAARRVVPANVFLNDFSQSSASATHFLGLRPLRCCVRAEAFFCGLRAEGLRFRVQGLGV